MELLIGFFDIKFWIKAVIFSMLCFLYLISSAKLLTYNSRFFGHRYQKFWFFNFSILLGGSLIGLGISMVLQSYAFISFIGGFITVFGAQIIVSTYDN